MDSDNDDGSVVHQLDEGASDISSEFDSSVHEGSDDGEDYTEEGFTRALQMIRDNDPNINTLYGNGDYDFIQNITNDEWEDIGRDISNNTNLTALELCDDALNDEITPFLFRGLTRSSSIEALRLRNNGFSTAVVSGMVPFLQNANYLQLLSLDDNNIQSEGFYDLCRALRDSPIEELYCDCCSIESIEINLDQFPKHLTHLYLFRNNINADGCREIAKLLQGGDSTLTYLSLASNKIDDEGIAILVDALENNTSLKTLDIFGNDGISKEGEIMMLQLVNDISSIKSTLQSNHSLTDIGLINDDTQILRHINMALRINENNEGNSEAAGREKVIQKQLHSVKRAELADLLGVSRSLYSEINPLHLPEVLSLVGRRHGQGELYVALKSSIAGVISTVNRREYITQQMAYHTAQLEELRDELAEIDAAEGNVAYSNKRRRKQ